MADHCRKQIRDAVQAYLAANVTTAISVLAGRVHPAEKQILPALLIYTNAESIEDMAKATTGRDRKLSRTLTMTIEALAMGDDVIDTLDAIAAQVEPLAMAAVPAWVKEIELTETAVELTGDALEPAGMLRLTYDLVYHAFMATPDTPA